MTWGKELQDPRLRAAVVDWAESLQRAAEERRTRHPRARRVLRLLALVWIVLAMGTLAFAVARGDWKQLVNILIWPLLWAVPVGRLARAPGRAIERNSGPPS